VDDRWDRERSFFRSGRRLDPRPTLDAKNQQLGEGTIARMVRGFLDRGEPVALDRVDASVFDPCPALRARIGLLGEGGWVIHPNC
jgi:hypothetical protein